jgi:excisionase family DNA binding protein
MTETRYSLTEAAVRLGISVRTLHGWVRAGKVGVIRVSPRLVFVDGAEIDRVLRGG